MESKVSAHRGGREWPRTLRVSTDWQEFLLQTSSPSCLLAAPGPITAYRKLNACMLLATLANNLKYYNPGA